MNQGILFEITRGFAKINLTKNRPIKKVFFSVLYTFSEILYVLNPILQRLLLLGLSIYSCHIITVKINEVASNIKDSDFKFKEY